MTETTEQLKEQYRERLRQARAEYDAAVEQARAARTELFNAAHRAGLSYYMIAQLTRTDGDEAGYGDEFVRLVCQGRR